MGLVTVLANCNETPGGVFMWVQMLVHPTHGIEYYSVWDHPSLFITNPWLKPASQTQFRPQLFSLPVSQPLPLTWILGPHSMAVSSLGGFWLRITWAFNYSWWVIFTGMIDDSSSQADFIPLLGFPPYFLHLPLASTPIPQSRWTSKIRRNTIQWSGFF